MDSSMKSYNSGLNQIKQDTEVASQSYRHTELAYVEPSYRNLRRHFDLAFVVYGEHIRAHSTGRIPGRN